MSAAHRAIVRREVADGAGAIVRPWPRLAADTVLGPPDAELPGLCWTLTEGAAGMVSQVTGLAAAVGLPYVHHTVAMRWPFSTMWPGFLPPWDGIFSDRTCVRPATPPRVVISCGRLGCAASLALKRRFGPDVFTVHIQDPKLPSRRFDLIVAPAHDGLTGRNVVQSLGAVHHLTAERLKAAAEAGAPGSLPGLAPPFVGVVLGGPNRYYAYNATDVAQLIDRLQRVVERHRVRLAVVPSRRTPPAVLETFQQAFGANHFVWDGLGENPYVAVLALASHVIVTGDSVSMVSEAAATRKPLYVYHFSEQRAARRFRRFHESFAHAGVTRPFEGRLESWTYASPDRTGLIASLIRQHLRST